MPLMSPAPSSGGLPGLAAVPLDASKPNPPRLVGAPFVGGRGQSGAGGAKLSMKGGLCSSQDPVRGREQAFEARGGENVGTGRVSS